jgi:hypothetical protein
VPRSTRDPEKEAIWRERIDGWKSSPLSVTVYCKENNFNENTFRAWQKVIANRDIEARNESARLLQTRRQRLRQQEKTETQPVFAPVKLVERDCTAIVAKEIRMGESRDGFIEVLTPGGYIVRLPLVSDLPNICMVLKAIEGASKQC